MRDNGKRADPMTGRINHLVTRTVIASPNRRGRAGFGTLRLVRAASISVGVEAELARFGTAARRRSLPRLALQEREPSSRRLAVPGVFSGPSVDKSNAKVEWPTIGQGTALFSLLLL